jgi:hypothetical protein
MNHDLTAGVNRLRDLPDWLRAPLQSERVIDSLRIHVPELASGQLAIRRCKAKRLFLIDDSGYWGGQYTLDVQDPATGAEQTLLLHGRVTAPWLTTPPDQPSGGALSGGALSDGAPFGSPGWHGFLPELNLWLEMEPPEKELPGLEQLTGAEPSRALVNEVFRAAGRLPAGVEISACTPRILSYKPGSRCTIRYDLEYRPPQADAPAAPRMIIGKTYRKPAKAQNAYEGMLALWHSPLAKGDRVTIAEPLAWVPEHKLMLQTTIPGETSLEDMLREAVARPGADLPSAEAMKTLHVYMKKAAAGLAAFHQSGANYGDAAHVEIRFEELHRLTHRLSILYPEITGAVLPLLTWLEKQSAAHPEDPLVPTHGTFNPEQVLIDGDRIGFIDFDDYCMAEPALDVGLFRAAIKDTGMNAPFPSAAPDETERRARLALLDEIGDVFLAEYERHAAISRARVALWEAADYLRNCVHYWIKVKPAEPDIAFLVLETHLQRSDKDFLQKASSSLTR